ncbi:MAG: hypothetical protein ACREJ4_01675 [Candidatus Methylomirabilaceae bacterium]
MPSRLDEPRYGLNQRPYSLHSFVQAEGGLERLAKVFEIADLRRTAMAKNAAMGGPPFAHEPEALFDIKPRYEIPQVLRRLARST